MIKILTQNIWRQTLNRLTYNQIVVLKSMSMSLRLLHSAVFQKVVKDHQQGRLPGTYWKFGPEDLEAPQTLWPFRQETRLGSNETRVWIWVNKQDLISCS